MSRAREDQLCCIHSSILCSKCHSRSAARPSPPEGHSAHTLTVTLTLIPHRHHLPNGHIGTNGGNKDGESSVPTDDDEKVQTGKGEVATRVR